MTMDQKRRMLIYCSSRCLTWHSLATAELIQHVVLLNGQPLLDAIRDHTVYPIHAGLGKSVLYVAGPT